MRFLEVLDAQIQEESEGVRRLDHRLEELRRERDHTADVLRKALDLYRELAERPHPLDRQAGRVAVETGRESPRLVELVSILCSERRPMAVSEIASMMIDRPGGGAVSAAAHRAVKKGLVRRVQRGVYEAAGAGGTPEEEQDPAWSEGAAQRGVHEGETGG